MGEFHDFTNWEYLRGTEFYANGLYDYTMGWLAGSSDEKEAAILTQISQNHPPEGYNFKNVRDVIELFKKYGFEITEEFLKQFEQDQTDATKQGWDEAENDFREYFGKPRLKEKDKRKPS